MTNTQSKSIRTMLETSVNGRRAAAAKARAAQTALGRLDEGIHRLCLCCGRKNGPRRLAAMTTASLCINSQDEAENRCEAAHRWELPMAA